MTLDERLSALTMNLELQAGMIADLRKLIEVDAANIRSLARIAEAHEHRLDHLDGE